MVALTDPIYQTVSDNLENRASLLVAFSGGIDSTVLLHTLHRLVLDRLEHDQLKHDQLKQDRLNRDNSPLNLRAIYIHHGLSQNADNWAAHCQAICQNWQIPLIIEHVEIDKSAGNIEEQARNARYQAIFQHLKQNESLCLAQHQDDQCETFLLALKRGSGPAGLSAMPQELTLHHSNRNITVLRPLLSISRAQIEAYADLHGLDWIEDESNQDDRYDRNFLRLTVLPALQSRWRHFPQMVARSAALCSQQEQLLTELLTPELEKMVGDQGELAIEPLLNCSEYKRYALIRLWLKRHSVTMPTQKQLTLIWQTVALAREDANPQFILGNSQIRRYQQALYLLPKYAETENINLSWDLKSSLTLPDHIGTLHVVNSQMADNQPLNLQLLDPQLLDPKLMCRLPNSDEQVTIRFHATGRIQIAGRDGSRPMKKQWQAHNIPSWQRTRIPLIFYNDRLITAVGQFVTVHGAGSEITFSLVN
ncbi:tRNA lysidine(34) synthetase TilS [Orbaceae bacterium ESL0721]|nr:tRNA lysidine(34) synthetase TilS [Orbaceae bacterium ESL0721]